MAARLLAQCPRTRTLYALVESGMGGGESAIWEVENRPDLLAATPVAGQDAGRYFETAAALVELGLRHPYVVELVAVLVSPKDRKSPAALLMKKVAGKPLEQLCLPVERAALGLDWSITEWKAVAVMICDLFAHFERQCVTQNDCNQNNYLVQTDAFGRPTGVVRIDPLAFGFHRAGKYFGATKVRWEFAPPEVQHLGRSPDGLSGYVWGRDDDRFGLAALLFACLTSGAGHVDYAGGDPDPARRVELKQFAVLSMPPGTKVPFEVEQAYYGLPPSVQTLFEKAFLGDAGKGGRPGPLDWKKALKDIGVPDQPATVRMPAVWTQLRAGWAALTPHRRPLAGAACLAVAVLLAARSVPTGVTRDAAGIRRPDVQTVSGHRPVVRKAIGHTVLNEPAAAHIPAARKPLDKGIYQVLNK